MRENKRKKHAIFLKKCNKITQLKVVQSSEGAPMSWYEQRSDRSRRSRSKYTKQPRWQSMYESRNSIRQLLLLRECMIFFFSYSRKDNSAWIIIPLRHRIIIWWHNAVIYPRLTKSASKSITDKNTCEPHAVCAFQLHQHRFCGS